MSNLENTQLKLEKSLIQKHEGFRDRLYDDPGRGNRAIGYGFNVDDKVVSKLLPSEVTAGKRSLKEEEAFPIFDKLFDIATTSAQSFVGPETYSKLDSIRQYVLKDMAYNLGANRLGSFKKMKKAIEAGDFNKAADEMVNSKWYGQVGNRGRFLQDLMRNGGQ